jgi:lauroyl/myristoyl acyltransferase
MCNAFLRPLRYLLHIAGIATAAAFRLIPRRRRFGAAKTLADAMTPIIRSTGAIRFRATPHFEGAAETALQVVLRILDQAGTAYDPDLRINGSQYLDAARRRGRGLLILSSHAVLGKILVRHLTDAGDAPLVVAETPMRFGGAPAGVIISSPSFLLQVRSLLRAGAFIFATADHEPKPSRRTFTVPTDFGMVFLSDGLIRVASKCGAEILFLASRRNQDGDVEVDLTPPAPSSVSVELITADFVAFVQSHVKRVQGRDVTASGSEHFRLKANKARR